MLRLHHAELRLYGNDHAEGSFQELGVCVLVTYRTLALLQALDRRER